MLQILARMSAAIRLAVPPATAQRPLQGVVLVALASRDAAPPRELVNRLRGAGVSVCVTHGWDGCLRVAAAVQPSVIYLDDALPPRLTRLLRGHPHGQRAFLCRIDASTE
jgi:hypothetical protein